MGEPKFKEKCEEERENEEKIRMKAKTKEDMRIYKYIKGQKSKSESWEAENVRKNSQKRKIKNAEEQGMNES